MYNICDLHYSMSSWCSNRGAPVQAAILDYIFITVYVVFVGSSLLDHYELRNFELLKKFEIGLILNEKLLVNSTVIIIY